MPTTTTTTIHKKSATDYACVRHTIPKTGGVRSRSGRHDSPIWQLARCVRRRRPLKNDPAKEQTNEPRVAPCFRLELETFKIFRLQISQQPRSTKRASRSPIRTLPGARKWSNVRVRLADIMLPAAKSHRSLTHSLASLLAVSTHRNAAHGHKCQARRRTAAAAAAPPKSAPLIPVPRICRERSHWHHRQRSRRR